jgi:hypothetical protein
MLFLMESERVNQEVTKTWNYVTAFRRPAFCWPQLAGSRNWHRKFTGVKQHVISGHALA